MSSEPDRIALAPTDDSGRYVVLLHRWAEGQSRRGGDHYDWMFETEGGLWTWATDDSLSSDRPAMIAATRLPDHRTEYLDYEGPVSGNRGTVSRVEAGRFRRQPSDPDRFEFVVSGGRSGEILIYRTRSDDSSSGWRIEFRPTRVEAS